MINGLEEIYTKNENLIYEVNDALNEQKLLIDEVLLICRVINKELDDMLNFDFDKYLNYTE